MYFVFPIWNMLLCLLQLPGLEEAQAHQASVSSQVCPEQHAFSSLTFFIPQLCSRNHHLKNLKKQVSLV